MSRESRVVGINKAEVRRAALRRALAAANMTPSEAARAAGFTTPNSIFNFLNERSSSLSQNTIERLASVIPGSSIASLTGNDQATPMTSTITGVQVRAIAEAGRMREAFDLPKKECYEAMLPTTAAQMRAGAFGVEVRTPGFERAFPDGTILVCVPAPAYSMPLHAGHHLIIQRVVNKLVEVTVKDLEVDGNKRAWLWPRSDRPEYQAPVKMPWPYTNEIWRLDGQRYSVTAVVVGAYMPFD